MTEIYLHIVARMADYIDTHPYVSAGKLPQPGYLEGNVVAGPDGALYDILRFNSKPVIGNKAVKLKLDLTTNTLVFQKILDFPGGHTKFVIR